MARTEPGTPLTAGERTFAAGRADIRPPKAGELVARRLRRMIVDGELKGGDSLPNEAALVEHFGVSRPTLREAVRVLESEGLVELRRGSRTGATVTLPGPEAVARPAGLQLQLSGATLADVYVARGAIEPLSARLLAESGDEEAFATLERELENARAFSGGAPEHFGTATAHFHLCMVRLCGNRTLALMAGMIHEIILRQSQTAARSGAPKAATAENFEKALRAYAKLIRTLRAGDGEVAERFWRKHLEVSDELVLGGGGATRILDVLD